MCILDPSKTLMYDFHSATSKRDTVTKPSFCSQIRTACIYEVSTENVYNDFYKDREVFDNRDTQQIAHSNLTTIRRGSAK